MDVFFEILKYTLPALLVLVTTYIMLSSFFDNEDKRRAYLLRRETRKTSLEHKLMAYERLALFLERISPNQLLLRIPAGKQTAAGYQSTLIKIIWQEFEHNVSQQVYVSDETWAQIVHAKSAMVGIINKVAGEIPQSTPAVELSKRILNYSMELENLPTKRALAFIKAEIRKEL